MRMPGSETTLEELICRILGDHLQAGFVSKLAVAETLLQNFTTLDQCNDSS